MKKALLFLTIAITAFILSRKAFDNTTALSDLLLEMNPEWSIDKIPGELLHTEASYSSDEEFITAHFMAVDKYLRSRPTAHLTQQQKASRERILGNLKRYYTAGRFPVNTRYQGRRPCFIDENGTTCAVAQLLIDDGKKDLAEYIAGTTNYAYIREMDHEGLKEWQAASGLTFEEIGLIQPSYIKPDAPLFGDIILQAGWYGATGTVTVFTPWKERTMNEYHTHGRAWEQGLLVQVPLKKRRDHYLVTGTGFTQRFYSHHFESLAQSNFGKIRTDYRLDYLSIPLVLSFERKPRYTRYKISRGRSLIQFGVITDLLLKANSSQNFFGDVSGLVRIPILHPGGDLRLVVPNLYVSTMFKVKLGEKRSVVLHGGPSMMCALAPDKKGNKRSGTYPATVSVRAGMAYTFIENHAKKTERTKQRQERKQKKQQEKDDRSKQKQDQAWLSQAAASGRS
jgi:hypothetical protein